MMKCGLLGAKLGHSYSPEIHRQLGDYSYCLYEKNSEELEEFLNSGDFTGLNVTIPYKKSVIPYCDTLSPIAEKLGAVNTLVRRSNGTLVGHNSDYFGFEAMLHASSLDVSGKKVLVLGSGGAAATAMAVLKEHGAQAIMISRSGAENYDNLHRHADAAVIVNTTPVGMFPNTGVSPLCLDSFPQLVGVLDVIYNPGRTQLLMDAEKRGLVTANGLLMLVAQAKESAEWFTGTTIPDDTIEKIHKKLRRKMENIVLIGMPGCGKSSIGKILAEKTGKQFLDTDAMIEEKAGCTIPELFEKSGEAAFRALETQVLSDVGKQSNLLIATGGGCVTREENYPLLHQNGCIFCVHRSLEALPKNGRPISQTTALDELYQIRKPLYDRFADFHIENSGTLPEAVTKILKIWEEIQ